MLSVYLVPAVLAHLQELMDKEPCATLTQFRGYFEGM